MHNAQASITELFDHVNRSVIGQPHVVKSLIIGLLTNGHVLLEGLPGTAKTRSIKTLAEALDVSFGRIQFTPDLLPSDVTGTEVYQEINGKPQLHFQAGPIFNSIVLADEINRAPAKVQAALLEAMAEGTITVSDNTHNLPELFMVLATQNPVEQEGTYPLPEAQMDRFMMKVNVDYPDDTAEKEIIRLVRNEEQQTNDNKPSKKNVHIDPNAILTGRKELTAVHVSDIAENYIVALIMATRHPERYPHTQLEKWIEVGASPRASIALDKCARAHAWLENRMHVLPDDIRAVAHSVLGHRISLSYDALADGISSKDVVQVLLNNVAIG
ncbi:AAA domain-containing protein [Aliivibrio fischeri]|uniref:AAA domain-containing protein n=1 Tax=Aliivibrio fischeri TaxID=668 RepID=A0A6N3YZU8_ALIFS|nr:MoxR family ATPase [Aliivibrio fischeri]MUK44941.1 AAA domain-containing protein [Aliivibrio fischeri]MUK61735.1 AAA domain-containing protein [Aliivibrio fischeri]MUK80600.1 AAA domain-containing protein [Aliivibrio fischeri]MUK84391.1 AAA domain-containing protein [Aliivibrio fischeri]MUL21994.1 AAA domain-containing protein [Aliivibrio fischeri]